jgi:hypothetical protein
MPSGEVNRVYPKGDQAANKGRRKNDFEDRSHDEPPDARVSFPNPQAKSLRVRTMFTSSNDIEMAIALWGVGRSVEMAIPFGDISSCAEIAIPFRGA